MEFPERAVDGILESYIIVIGRRNSMSDNDKRQLLALNEHGIEIMTYDGLMDQYKKEAQYWGKFLGSVELIDPSNA